MRIILRLYQRLINKVCKCNHEQYWHHPLEKGDRSDEQCGAFIFEGGAFGDGGTLHCCQCLSYHQRESRFKSLYHDLKLAMFGFPKLPDAKESAKSFYCVCGHSAFDHDIGNDERIRLDVLYPECNLCSCKEYDYVNNPKIARHEIQKNGDVKQ